MMLSEKFWHWKQAQKKVNLCHQKSAKKSSKTRQKLKWEKPKEVLGHFPQILITAHDRTSILWKAVQVQR